MALEVFDAREATYDVNVETAVEFAVHDGVSLQGDLYLPGRDGVYPGLVMLHGGAWRGGAPGSMQAWGRFLAARGYVVFAATYRVVNDGQSMFPQAIQDARSAVQFVRGRGRAVRVDADRIAVSGSSAGGEVAALVALAGDDPMFAGAYPSDTYADVSARTQAAVLIYGFYDMVKAWEDEQLGDAGRPARDYLGGDPSDKPEVFRQASALSWVGPSSKQLPFFVAWGTADPHSRPASQSQPLVAALREAGCKVEPVELDGAEHFWFSLRPGQPTDSFEPDSWNARIAGQLVQFLDQHLGR
jgi:acetyl esterase/lipase